MRKSILIDSTIEFVIVGPILGADGIIVQSQNAKMDLIGVSYKIYRWAGENILEKNNFPSSLNINYMWVEMVNPDNTSRKYKLLFCWKNAPAEGVSFPPNLYDKKHLRPLIKTELDKFIENAYNLLRKYIGGPTFNIDKEYEKYVDMIKWYISPLLLQCQFPEMNFKKD